jgi:transposase-like protein
MWVYVYRAIDKQGKTVDFYLSSWRAAKSTNRFLGKALRGLKGWEKPPTINTNKAPACDEAIGQLKKEGKCLENSKHRQIKYLNNRVEADHDKSKRLINHVRGFQSMKTAYATIKGF